MDDVVLTLLPKIQEEFDRRVSNDRQIQRFLRKVEEGKATGDDASLYARSLGDHLANTFRKLFTPENMPDGTIYWNIAERIVKTCMTNNYNLVNAAAKQVQKTADTKMGIRLKPVSGVLPEERIHQIIEGIADQTADIDTIRSRMDAPIRNTSQSFYDDFVSANMEFRAQSGFKATLTRTAEPRCCEWCQDMAGSWVCGRDIIPDDVYARHDNCRCTVTYRTERTATDVWTKKPVQRSNESNLKRFSQEEAKAMEDSLPNIKRGA